MSFIENFHFIRPVWLLVIPLFVLILLLRNRSSKSNNQPNVFFAPHLKKALTIDENSGLKFTPIDGYCLALCFLCLAAAGPAWSKEHSPWFSETAPLVIAIEVSDSMRSNDLQPTRLDRARLKIIDLLELRTGGRTGLIAYAGTAHIVIPPTKDLTVIKTFLESLDPAIMPQSGAKASNVLELGGDILSNEARTGTILFVCDGFESTDPTDFESFSNNTPSPSLVAWVMGSNEGGVALMPDGTPATSKTGGRIDTTIDQNRLVQMSRKGNTDIVRATRDKGDSRLVYRKIESNLKEGEDPQSRWIDKGWYFLIPALLINLLSFRRGWSQIPTEN